MQGNDNNKKSNNEQWGFLFKIGVMVFVTFVCSILFFFFLFRFDGFATVWGKLLHTMQPIIIGAVLAYLMNPIMKRIEKFAMNFLKKRVKDEKKVEKASRAIGVTGSILVLVMIIALLIAAVVPALISSVTSLADTAPTYVNKTVDLIQNGNFGDSELAELVSEYMEEGVAQLDKWTKESLLPQAQKYIAQITAGVINVVKGVLNFIIGIIVMVYILTIKETFVGQAKKVIYAIFKPQRGNVIIHVARRADSIFGGFITGKILDSAIVGAICYIGCLILRIPDSILVATIIGVTNIIPVFGPFIGAVPTLFIVVIQSPWHALYLLIFVIVLQQVDGNIIGPKILGSSTGLSTFWVMFAILVGGGLFGFAGMLLGVPTFGVIYYIITKIVDYILSKRKLPTNTNEYVELRKIDAKTNKIIYREEH